MLMKFLTCFLLVCASFTAIIAQQPADEEKKVVLPDAQMKQIVSRIVRWNFRPSRIRKTIPISDIGIKREWLPTITNVTFELVPENDVPKYEKGVFLFEKLEKMGRVYSINVGWGDLDCDASGDTWKFRIDSGNVRLWRLPALVGWGRVCGKGNGPPVIRGLKLGDISPNELPGYEFFRKGKLKDIRLGISTSDDMKKIFGETCEEICDYDDNWRVWVKYFEKTTTMSETSSDLDGTEIKTEFVP